MPAKRNPAREALTAACAKGDPIYAITTRRYFVTDCWIGAGGHLRRYEVTGPDGHVGIFKTLGEAVYCADSLDAADTR